MKRYHGSENEEEDTSDSSYKPNKQKKRLLKKLLADAEERKRKFNESQTAKYSGVEEMPDQIIKDTEALFDDNNKPTAKQVGLGDDASDSGYKSKKQKKKLLKKLLADAEERKRKFNESQMVKNIRSVEGVPDVVIKDAEPSVDNNNHITTEQVALNDGNNKLTEEHSQSASKIYRDGYASSDDSSSVANADGTSKESQVKENALAKDAGFTILGEVDKSKKRKIQRVLPDWLANPFVVTSDLHGKKMHVNECHALDSTIRQKLEETGIVEFFPVQKEIVPLLITVNANRWWCRPNDVCVSAPTGSGKTLAFVLPVIQSLKDRVVTAVRCLAVLPVRDLAVQVYNVFKHYCKATSLSVVQITGVKSFAEEQTILGRNGIRGYHSLADIVVATPGRLIDHIHGTPGFSLQQLRFLILDEADRMMDEIQQGWLTEVEKAIYGENHMPSNCCRIDELFQVPRSSFVTSCSFGQVHDPVQKLLYSATLSQDSEKIQQLSLFYPKLICANSNAISNCKTETNIEKYVTPVELKEYYTLCELPIKPLIAWYLIKSKEFNKVLCFTNSVESSHRLSLVLKEIGELTVSDFSSRLSGIQRKKALKSFLSGNTNVLVCSDVMARGMDIEDIDCVMLYDMPSRAKTYVHRVGRTARAGKSGTAITLMENNERKKFFFMMKSVSRKNLTELQISQSELKTFQERYQKALKNAASSIESEHHQQILKKHPVKRKTKSVSNVKASE